MTTIKDRRARLKQLLADPEIVVAPGCGDAVTAQLIARAGLGAAHVSGSVAHRTSGYADAGILTLTEMTSRIAAISDRSDIPIIADADTGFGAPVNVIRTVRDYERAGACAIHIEDQLTPKRPIYQEGQSGGFVSRGEMVDKIRAALDTREDPNLLIVARCDVDDWDEKLERIAACVEAGADVAWLSARGADKMAAIREAAGGKPAMGVLPRDMTLAQYRDAGASCALVPGALQIAALCVQLSLLEELRETGSYEAYLSALPHSEEMRKFYGQQGNADLAEIERRYGGAPEG